MSLTKVQLKAWDEFCKEWVDDLFDVRYTKSGKLDAASNRKLRALRERLRRARVKYVKMARSSSRLG